MGILTAKILNDKLKFGWIVADFAQYLDITEEEFWKQLNKNFTSSARKGFKSKLDTNQRRRKRRTQNTGKSVVKAKNVTESAAKEVVEEVAETIAEEVVEEVAETIAEEVVEEVTDSAAKEVVEEVTDSVANEVVEEVTESVADDGSRTVESNGGNMTKADFEGLLREKEACTEAILELEYRKQGILTDNVAIKSEATRIQEEYEKYVALAKAAKEKATKLLERKAANEVALEEISKEKRAAETTLSELNDKIDECNKVIIFVYSSGEYCIESYSVVGVPTNYKDIFYELIEEEMLASLNIKQHRALATVISFAKDLKVLGRKFEVSFEDELCQKYFDNYMKEE